MGSTGAVSLGGHGGGCGGRRRRRWVYAASEGLCKEGGGAEEMLDGRGDVDWGKEGVWEIIWGIMGYMEAGWLSENGNRLLGHRQGGWHQAGSLLIDGGQAASGRNSA